MELCFFLSRNQMRSESEGQSHRRHRPTRPRQRSPQRQRREKHNRGQRKKPSCQQHQEAHDLHSKIPRLKAKRFTRTVGTQVKISQSHRNPTRRPNKNKYGSRSVSCATCPFRAQKKLKRPLRVPLFLMQEIEKMDK